MKIEQEYPCTCGHAASYHEVDIKEHPVEAASVYVDEKIHYPIFVVKGYKACSYDKTKETPNFERDKDAWTGVSYDYTNFGRYCHCQEFKLDNLKFLESKVNG